MPLPAPDKRSQQLAYIDLCCYRSKIDPTSPGYDPTFSQKAILNLSVKGVAKLKQHLKSILAIEVGWPKHRHIENHYYSYEIKKCIQLLENGKRVDDNTLELCNLF